MALSWGLCAVLPVGVIYLHLCLMLLAMALAPDVVERLRALRGDALAVPIAVLAGWTLLAALVGDWYPDTVTRLFHTARVAVVLFLGLMLTPAEARVAVGGFLASAVLAALLVAAHHVWGLPDWRIWSSLLVPRNNFSSANMVTLATACGVYVHLGLRAGVPRSDRGLALLAALALGITVALHSLSRNSLLLLAALVLAAVVCRFRTFRALVGGVAVVVALAGLAWQFSANTQNRFHEMVSNLEAVRRDTNYATSIGVRWRMYQEAVQGMADNPLFGTGVGSWLPRWQSVWQVLGQNLPPAAKQGFSDINNPHNDYLLAGMETGVAGMLIMLWLVLRFLRAGWRQAAASGGPAVVMAVAVGVTAMVNAPFRDAAFGMTLLWLLAASVASHRARRHE